MLKILTWTAVIAGMMAIPLLVRKRFTTSAARDLNVRYDIDDYVSEVNL
ncbi:MAG TPA: hypothetical protein VMM58_03465 [Bacteroidota bacterium]|nr:hypothetical protein [Bacteroidota bacterium]